jgi:hypothetical protein
MEFCPAQLSGAKTARGMWAWGGLPTGISLFWGVCQMASVPLWSCCSRLLSSRDSLRRRFCSRLLPRALVDQDVARFCWIDYQPVAWITPPRRCGRRTPFDRPRSPQGLTTLCPSGPGRGKLHCGEVVSRIRPATAEGRRGLPFRGLAPRGKSADSEPGHDSRVAFCGQTRYHNCTTNFL